ncbi:MGMT family protein [Chloroflexi bacterium TSY]|nr:MGMT family protein [Chloroflexi bacterium TSY]
MRQVVRQIPYGQVATYGQIASIVGGCTARMVGYTMAGLPLESDVPWHRVLNAQGKISPRGNPLSAERQRTRLEDEGVRFDGGEVVNLRRFQWKGLDWEWLLEHGYRPQD